MSEQNYVALRRAAKRIASAEIRRIEGQIYNYLSANPIKRDALIAAQKAADETARQLRSLSDEIGAAASEHNHGACKDAMRALMDREGLLAE